MNRALLWVAMVTIVSAVVWIVVSVWGECRSEGHSFFYCLSLVSG